MTAVKKATGSKRNGAKWRGVLKYLVLCPALSLAPYAALSIPLLMDRTLTGPNLFGDCSLVIVGVTVAGVGVGELLFERKWQGALSGPILLLLIVSSAYIMAGCIFYATMAPRHHDIIADSVQDRQKFPFDAVVDSRCFKVMNRTITASPTPKAKDKGSPVKPAREMRIVEENCTEGAFDLRPVVTEDSLFISNLIIWLGGVAIGCAGAWAALKGRVQ